MILAKNTLLLGILDFPILNVRHLIKFKLHFYTKLGESTSSFVYSGIYLFV